jgi:hypothetical protein
VDSPLAAALARGLYTCCRPRRLDVKNEVVHGLAIPWAAVGLGVASIAAIGVLVTGAVHLQPPRFQVARDHSRLRARPRHIALLVALLIAAVGLQAVRERIAPPRWRAVPRSGCNRRRRRAG